MSIVLLGATSGSVTLQEPAVAGSTVIDLPATSGTMAVTSGSPSFTNVTATGTLTVNGNTTLGDASTDTILMTGAPSIGGAGLGMGMGFRNRIINGAMVIDQRNAGASQTPTTDDTFNVDRWAAGINIASKFSMQQNTADAPTTQGFTNCVKITSLSAYSIAAGNVAVYKQIIEGFNIADLAWGTASAAPVTLSFWVRSSLTGTFGGTLMNGGQNRAYPFTYTISVANTWEQKTITIAGDTTGTWATGNTAGIRLNFQLGVGSTFLGTAGSWSANNYFGATGATNIIATNTATWFITGVQLEKGSTATSFDYRPYGTELQLCQRYFNTVKAMNGTSGGTTTTMYSNVSYPEMRAAPTYAVTGAIIATDPANASYTQSSGNVSVAGGSYSNGAFLAFGNFSGMTANRVIMLNTATTYLTLSAEL